MKFKIKHEIRGRIRIHMEQKRMTHEQADILLFYLQNIDGVFRADEREECPSMTERRTQRFIIRETEKQSSKDSADSVMRK